MTLVFEFLDQDLKKYLDQCESGLDVEQAKVKCFDDLEFSPHLACSRSCTNCLMVWRFVTATKSFTET